MVHRLLLFTSSLSLMALATSAQVVPDGSLPTQVSSGETVEITGGAEVGDNLFHSFTEFSVPTEQTVFFNNAANIANIISRVTGGKVSNIDGLIRANGGANLFLLNPNGILFGPNARLDIGGSFLASTAESLQFADGSAFMAAAGETPGLTVSVPVGLQMSPAGGAIQVQGPDPALTAAAPNGAPLVNGGNAGLQVQPGETLALVGNTVTLAGGTLTAAGGRVELGSVADGTVALQPTATGWSLDYQDVQLQDLAIARSLVDASSPQAGGSIQLQGRQITLQDGAVALIQTGSQPAGTLSAIASESLEISGTNADGTVRTSLINETVGSGAGGDIFVAADQLRIQDGATITAQTFGSAASGDITIDTTRVDVIGSVNPNVTSSIAATTFATNGGDTGEITIDTEQLTIADGATITTATLGDGNGGDITIRSTESVAVVGTGSEGIQRLVLGGLGLGGDPIEILFNLNNSISAGASAGGTAGHIAIETGQLSLVEGAVLASATIGSGRGGDLDVTAEAVEVSGSGLFSVTLGSGQAGNVRISNETLTVQDGSIISTSTVGSGAGGELTIEASDIELLGTPAGAIVPTGFFSNSLATGPAGDLKITTQRLEVRDGTQIAAQSGGQLGEGPITNGGAGGSLMINASESIEVDGISPDGRFKSTLSTATFSDAPAGNLELTTGRLAVENQAEVAVNSLGAGQAGELMIEADSVLVNDQAAINATTFSGQGGTIRIAADDVRWRNNSETTVRALRVGDGGNVIIEADTVVALEDSDINASAQQGNGGQIQITAQGIFLCAECEVNADSDDDLGVDGVVELNVPEVEQLESLELPQEVISSEQVVALSCAANGGETSQFTITGRSGLPPRPSEPLSPQALVSFDDAATDAEAAIAPEADAPLPPPAQGWHVNEQGVVVLAAAGTAPTGLTPPDCPTP